MSCVAALVLYVYLAVCRCLPVVASSSILAGILMGILNLLCPARADDDSIQVGLYGLQYRRLPYQVGYNVRRTGYLEPAGHDQFGFGFWFQQELRAPTHEK
eukprot:scaffold44868_cov59-Attheya_sp.AAC.4